MKLSSKRNHGTHGEHGKKNKKKVKGREAKPIDC
jgi:hypothetical protein